MTDPVQRTVTHCITLQHTYTILGMSYVSHVTLLGVTSHIFHGPCATGTSRGACATARTPQVNFFKSQHTQVILHDTLTSATTVENLCLWSACATARTPQAKILKSQLT